MFQFHLPLIAGVGVGKLPHLVIESYFLLCTLNLFLTIYIGNCVNYSHNLIQIELFSLMFCLSCPRTWVLKVKRYFAHSIASVDRLPPTPATKSMNPQDTETAQCV